MFNRMVVQEALKRSWELGINPGRPSHNPAGGLDSLISLLIHDVFGGEILKAHKKNGWYFYNRINGERLDFTKSEIGKSPEYYCFEDLPSAPDETYNYFEQEDYLTFYMRFVRAFEETVGLEEYQPVCTT